MDDFIKRSDALKVIETANSMVSSLLEATTKLCGIMNRIAAADVEPVRHGRWIPVTERLPENDDFVIVTVKDESGDSPYVYSDFGWYFDRAECWIVETEKRTDITHWMPLPKPPKEET